MLDPGVLVWTAVKPILKLGLMFGIAALFARRGIILPEGSKLISKLLINLFYPCLLFTKSSLAINEGNIDLLGIIIPFSCIYIIIGCILGCIVRLIVKPAEHFKNGIVMATAMGNMGDLPIAIILSVGDSIPFSKGDSSLGVALVTAFCLVPNFFAFTVGYRSIQSDFEKTKSESLVQFNTSHDNVILRSEPELPSQILSESLTGHIESSSHKEDSIPIEKKKLLYLFCKPFIKLNLWIHTHCSPTILMGLKAIASPPNIAALTGIIVACSPPLRSLFIASASDTIAPLGMFFEVADFLGAAGIPLAVISLGAALGNLNLARFPPWAYSIGISCCRLVILPIIGISIVQLVRHLGWIPIHIEGATMLVFVLMLESSVPTANTAMFLTQMMSPDGRADDLAGVMLVEYVCCFFTITTVMIVIFALL